MSQSVRSQPARARAQGIAAAVAWIDQKHARFVLHPGSQEPGGGGWSQLGHLPVEQRPGLIAAWNGAFRITNGDANC
jgi:hypothetical protein